MAVSPHSSALAVTFYDQNGTKLVNADTLSLGRVIALQPGSNQVRMGIEALYLNPGVYHLGLYLADSAGVVLDSTTAAMQLEVVDLASPGFGARPGFDGVVPCRFQVWEGEGVE